MTDATADGALKRVITYVRTGWDDGLSARTRVRPTQLPLETCT